MSLSKDVPACPHHGDIRALQSDISILFPPREMEDEENEPAQIETLTVSAYDWTVRDAYGGEDNMVIHCWALDTSSAPYLLRILNFPAVCYVELPSIVGYRQFPWHPAQVRAFMDVLNYRLGSHAAESHSIYKRRKLYYYRAGSTFPMLMLRFRHINSMERCAALLQNPLNVPDIGYVTCSMWEHKISPIRKLLTAKKLRYAEWFTVSGIPVDPDYHISTCAKEYIIDWKSIRAVPAEKCTGWTTNPGVLAFDIECYSSNHRAMPDKYNALHVAYMISAIYQRYNRPETRVRYGIIIGPCEQVPLPNTTIISVNSELEMVQAFADIIKLTDPEIVTGYNILGFDYPYLDTRLKRRLHDWPCMGRLNEPAKLNVNSWESSAYGMQTINTLIMDGRISVDLMISVRRDYKLDSYTLNYVCNYFLGSSKHDVKPVEMFEIYEELLTASKPTDTPLIEQEERKERAIANMTRVMAYCIQDSDLVIDLFEKLNTWVYLVEMSNIMGVTIYDLFTRGQQVRGLSQIYNLAAHDNYVVDSRDFVNSKYTGALIFPPIPGLYENTVCLDFASLYPSIVIAYNICYSTLVPPEYNDVVRDEDCHVIQFTQEEVIDEEEDDEDEDEENEESSLSLMPVPKTLRKKAPVNKQICHYRYRFYKKQQGILPRLVAQLIAERKEVRAILSKEKDPNRKKILDARQLALKVSANSFYGLLGVREGGKLPLLEGAMSVTALGRQLIMQVRDYIEKTYDGKMVYGDTDSCMVTLNITDRKQCQYWGEKLAQEISGVMAGDLLPGSTTERHTADVPGLFAKPLRMEFEKAMRLLCIKKKKYAALLVTKQGEFKMAPRKGDEPARYDILKRGIVLARRDNCKLLQEVYSKILHIILEQGSYLEALQTVVDAVTDLIEGQVAFERLVIVKSVGAHYKSANATMKVFADNLRKAGQIVSPGDRLDYVMVANGQEKLCHKMMLRSMYESALLAGTAPPLDYNYYIERQLCNPINQLFAVGFRELIEPSIFDLFYVKLGCRSHLTMDMPVSIIAGMLTDGVPIDQLMDMGELVVNRSWIPREVIAPPVVMERKKRTAIFTLRTAP